MPFLYLLGTMKLVSIPGEWKRELMEGSSQKDRGFLIIGPDYVSYPF